MPCSRVAVCIGEPGGCCRRGQRASCSHVYCLVDAQSAVMCVVCEGVSVFSFAVCECVSECGRRSGVEQGVARERVQGVSGEAPHRSALPRGPHESRSSAREERQREREGERVRYARAYTRGERERVQGKHAYVADGGTVRHERSHITIVQARVLMVLLAVRNCSRHRYRHADALQVLSCR